MERISEQLKGLLLQKVEFIVDGKVLKQGVVKLYNTKQFFIKFNIQQDGEFREWELPYPFDLRKTSTGYLFDYALSAFCPRTEDAYWKMLLLKYKDEPPSKIHNNHLYVKVAGLSS